MGLNQFQFSGQVMTMLTDWGPPLLRSTESSGDAYDQLGVELSGDPLPFSWSVIVADFNRDGRDDFVLTRGSLIEVRDEAGDEADKLFVQSEGAFSDQTATSGLKEHPPALQGNATPRHYSRAGTTTDFDRDGRLELLIMPFEGRPLLYESNAETHCMVNLRALAGDDATGSVYGWSWMDFQGFEHPLRIDGHMRLGEPEWAPLPARNDGLLVSPSGARIQYSCEPGERIAPDVPNWIRVENNGVTLDLCAVGLQDTLVQSKTGNSGLIPVTTTAEGLAQLPLDETPTEIYIDGRFGFRCSLEAGCSR
jgi:hypothetical protein